MYDFINVKIYDSQIPQIKVLATLLIYLLKFLFQNILKQLVHRDHLHFTALLLQFN